MLFMLIGPGALIYFLLSYLLGVEVMYYATAVLKKRLGLTGLISYEVFRIETKKRYL